MKKTLARRPDASADHDPPECLTFQGDLDQLHQAPGSNEEEAPGAPNEPPRDEAPSKKAAEPGRASAPQNAAVGMARTRRPAEVEDAPASAAEALVAIVSSGLRTKRAGLDVSQSIRLLAKGEI